MAKKKKDGVEIRFGFKDRFEIPKLFPAELQYTSYKDKKTTRAKG